MLHNAANPPLTSDSASSLTHLRRLGWLCMLLFVVLYAAVGAYRYADIRAEADLRLNRALRIASEHALRVFDTNEVVMARVMDALGEADNQQVQAQEKLLHAQFQQMLQNKPQIHGIWVRNAQGVALATNRTYPAPKNMDAADRDYFQWHRSQRSGSFISAPFEGRVSGQRLIALSNGRYGGDGAFEGTVTVNLRPAYFEEFHHNLAADEPGVAINLLRADGTILSRWPPVDNAPPRLAESSPVMTMILEGRTAGVTEGVSSVDGRRRLLMFNKLGDYPLYMGTGIDMHNITRRWAIEMAWLAAFGLPPLAGLLLALRTALARSRESLLAAERLREESLALRRVEEALLQAQKLEALGRITGGVAHDFNNALMVISNNLYILQHKLPEGERHPQLASMGRAVASSTKLTRQLLAFSRRQALVPEHFRLQERLPLLRDLLGPVLGSKIALHIEIAPDTHAIELDPAEFELALINLAVNARDAMPAGGNFTLRATNTDANTATDLPPLLRGALVLLECVDDGPGVALEHQHKVFEPFFTTKPVGQGTGLGLSQVYGLCQRAGGIATLHSTPGHGATVRMYFPAGRGTPSPALPPASPMPRDLGKRVLLVEDNAEVSHALVPVMESMGCAVHLEGNAADARRWLQEQRERGQLPDLVLSDVVMPGDMDGVALASHVRAHFPGVRILLMSGYTEQLDAVTRLGFDILPKPCSAQTLAQAMAGRPAGGAASMAARS